MIQGRPPVCFMQNGNQDICRMKPEKGAVKPFNGSRMKASCPARLIYRIRQSEMSGNTAIKEIDIIPLNKIVMISFIVSTMGASASEAPKYRQPAIGGVIVPMLRLQSSIAPKCIGSMPKATTVGINSGVMIRIPEFRSTIMPSINRIRFSTIRNMILLEM